MQLDPKNSSVHDRRGGFRRGPLAAWRFAFATILFALTLLGPGSLFAQTVVPTERVTRGVLVREAPRTGAPVVGALKPGESAPLVATQPGWYQIRRPDGGLGYVSKTWTDVTAVSAAATGAAAPTYRIHVVDVGTGLAMFVEGPDFALVYDAGSNDDKGLGPRNRMLAYLKATHPQLTTIDHLILSHPHQDHVLLLADLIGAYKVGNVYDSGRVNAICGYRAFLEAIAAQPTIAYHDAIGGPGTRSVAFPKGCHGKLKASVVVKQSQPIPTAPIALGQGAQLTFLYRDATPYEDPNGNSLVARLDLGPVRVLLMGDAEAGERRLPSAAPDEDSIEAQLLACCRAALKANVLVVGHHGSKTSSRDAFLDAVAASTFVISGGPFAYSGTVLPDSEVVADLSQRGALWRTDVDDAACEVNPAKVGRDADGAPGGCDNIVITVHGAQVSVADVKLSD
jgi:competence protein ComEC